MNKKNGQQFPLTMFAVLAILVLWVCSSLAEASNWTCTLTDRQQEVLTIAHTTGAPYNLSYTMVAIAMQESRLGKWNVALGENSFSPFHVRIKHVLVDQNWKPTRFNKNRAAQMLLDDDWYAARLSLGVLRWWHNYQKTWVGAVSSYNGGHRGNPDYVEKIRNNIQHIQKCNWTKNLEGRVNAKL